MNHEKLFQSLGIPEGLKILVCGSRDFPDKSFVWKLLYRIKPRFIVTGGQGKKRPNRGADWHAEDFARTNKLPHDVVHADWDAFGRSAGPRRNSEMLILHPDIEWVVALPGERGTADMVSKSKRAGIPVTELEAVPYEVGIYKIKPREGDSV